jgi:hypothetical protein
MEPVAWEIGALSMLHCGNIHSMGITGTLVIEESTASIFLDAVVAGSSGPRHLVFGLSVRDGSFLPGWPVDVAAAPAANGQAFNPGDQGQRGALAIVNGVLFVPFGGHFGDCGDYHGWVIGISLRDPQVVTSWAIRARGGGIWAPGGISTDGKSLFVATGNTFDAATWGEGEAVFRLPPDLHRADRTQDHFAPVDWYELDRRDADLGGTNAAERSRDRRCIRRSAAGLCAWAARGKYSLRRGVLYLVRCSPIHARGVGLRRMGVWGSRRGTLEASRGGRGVGRGAGVWGSRRGIGGRYRLDAMRRKAGTRDLARGAGPRCYRAFGGAPGPRGFSTRANGGGTNQIFVRIRIDRGAPSG